MKITELTVKQAQPKELEILSAAENGEVMYTIKLPSLKVAKALTHALGCYGMDCACFSPLELFDAAHTAYRYLRDTYQAQY